MHQAGAERRTPELLGQTSNGPCIRTRPYTPRTNGKVERFIQTLCSEWAYGMPFQNSEEHNQWLPRYLSIYNRLRKHTALGGRAPQQRLNELLC